MGLNEYQIVDNNLYLVCEYFEGQEILEIIEKEGKLKENDAKTIIYSVMIGISHLHTKNIIHRDLKLENVLVRRDKGQIEQVKIIDLGLSIKIEGEIKGFFGTPNYMPPEAFSKRGYDFKFDVFSIGVILYTMLVGNFPFHDDTLKGLSFKILNKEPPWQKIVDEGGSDECIDLLKHLLEKDKEKR